MVYPVRFTPIYKQMPWGGDKIGRLPGRSVPFAKTGESWDISCRPNEMGVAANGAYAGRRFDEIIAEDPERWLGARLARRSPFPLLVKIIDAADDLSIQVHPDDAQAMSLCGEKYGKNEMWYILDAPEGGELIIGLNQGVTKEVFLAALEDGNVESILSRLPVKKGDVVMIPAGLVHAITAGVMLAEIQQNCDLTFRVYDYNRPGLDGKPRELHVDKAAQVIDFNGVLAKGAVRGLAVGNSVYYIANEYFAVIKRGIEKKTAFASDAERFTILTCVEGFCVIHQNEVKVPLTVGDSVFVPAGFGEYTVDGGRAALLESFVPNVEKDFLGPLCEAGYTDAEISASCSISRSMS